MCILKMLWRLSGFTGLARGPKATTVRVSFPFMGGSAVSLEGRAGHSLCLRRDPSVLEARPWQS